MRHRGRAEHSSRALARGELAAATRADLGRRRIEEEPAFRDLGEQAHARLARDVLHDGDGALADERDRHRLGANALARDAAGGGGCVEEGGWLGPAYAEGRY